MPLALAQQGDLPPQTQSRLISQLLRPPEDAAKTHIYNPDLHTYFRVSLVCNAYFTLLLSFSLAGWFSLCTPALSYYL
jgi:hypothetical protein